MVSRIVKQIGWLEDLNGGASPLLTTRERELVEEIYYEAESEIKKDTFDSFENAGDIQQRIEILEKNLQCIVRHFRYYHDARRDFTEKYPAWREARLRSIEALQTIGTSLHTDRRNCNITRLVGNCTSLVGGGIFVASVALAPLTLGLSTPVAVAGGITTVLGSATSVGTSITEIALLKKKVEEAQDIVKKDIESFESLKLWLTQANDITEALNAVLNVDTDKSVEETVNTIRNFVNLALQIQNELERHRVIKTLIEVTKEILPQEFGHVRIIANLVGLLVVIAMLNNNNPKIFQDVSKTMKVVTTGLSLLETSASVIRPFIKTDAVILQNVGKNVGQISATAVARGAVAVIGMSLDVASIVLTSLDVHKGSLSEEGRIIIDAAEKMMVEADMLKKVYFELVYGM